MLGSMNGHVCACVHACNVLDGGVATWPCKPSRTHARTCARAHTHPCIHTPIQAPEGGWTATWMAGCMHGSIQDWIEGIEDRIFCWLLGPRPTFMPKSSTSDYQQAPNLKHAPMGAPRTQRHSLSYYRDDRADSASGRLSLLLDDCRLQLRHPSGTFRTGRESTAALTARCS